MSSRITLVRAQTAAFFIASVLAIPAAGAPVVSGSRPAAETALSKIHIDNFGRVSAASDQITAMNYAAASVQTTPRITPAHWIGCGQNPASKCRAVRVSRNGE